MAANTSPTFRSHSTHPLKFDVFLSFRGEDTRKSFTDHLYTALDQSGIFTFRDDEELKRGETISSELFNAIEGSRISVVVLSRNYASSTWCLSELAKIIECKNNSAQIVLPLFYNVDPSDVRKQTGNFEADFARHEQVFKQNMEKVESWREAFTHIASLAGWDLKDRHESKVICEIVERILSELNQTAPSLHQDFVGMDSRFIEAKSVLGIGLHDVRAIGIWGMPGVGKTTMAEVIFERILSQFEAGFFFSNVRYESENHGLVHIQEKLYTNLFKKEANIQYVNMGMNVIRNRLRHKRVLLVLDDVDQFKQIEAVAGKGGEELYGWFGQGSRIIITTRDESLLKKYGATIYKVERLTDDEALLLFSRKAFKKDHAMDNSYADLAYHFVDYADGLPLALEVWGSFLMTRTLVQWSGALRRLKDNPPKKILDKLKLSYDGLETPEEKKMFLDIACFFKGEDVERVKRIFKSSGYHPDISLSVLLDKSLVTIERGKLWMHDLLQEMGQDIVCGESSEEPGKRSRLWRHIEALEVLSKDKGTEAVEGIFLSPSEQTEAHLTSDPFPKLYKLRLLKIHNVKFSGCIEFLSNELQFLEWHGYPLKSMPLSFKPKSLVEIIMPQSRIKQLWFREPLETLVTVNLSDCEYLIKTPDFNTTPKLERLILKGCKRLSEVHPSITVLQQLILFNLKGCECLGTLPDKISLGSLKTFILSGCSKLKKFPEVGENMEQLSKLHLDGTAIKELPASIKHLTGLILLNLKDCKKLSSLPENYKIIECLQELDVSGSAIRQVPSSTPKNLERLSLHGCRDLPCNSRFSLLSRCLLPSVSSIGLQLPASFSGLGFLSKLDLSDCSLFEGSIPDDLACLSSLQHLNLSGNNFLSIPESLSELAQLKELELNNCSKLQSLPKLPPSIRHVYARDCSGLQGSYSNQSPFWTTTAAGLSMLDFGRHEESNYIQTTPLQSAHLKLLYQKFHEDAIYEGRSFELDFRQKENIPAGWLSSPRIGSSIKIPLIPQPDCKNGTWIGLALYFVYDVGQLDQDLDSSDEPSCKLYSSKDSDFNCEYSCHLYTKEEVPHLELVKEIHLQDPSAGSYGHFLYEPGSSFKEKLMNDGSFFIRASVTIDKPEVKVKSCEACLIYEKDVGDFVGNLIRMCYQDHPDHILDHLASNPLWGFPTSVDQRVSLELTAFSIPTDLPETTPSSSVGESCYPLSGGRGFICAAEPHCRGMVVKALGWE